MIINSQFRTVDSVETFTIFSIERTEIGLDILIRDARQAGRSLVDGDVAAGLRTLQSLIERLYDFRQFVRDVCDVFTMDPALIRDADGSLADNADLFRNTLYELSAALETYDTTKLSRLLGTSLPTSLARFRDLMPILRNRIAPDMPEAA